MNMMMLLSAGAGMTSGMMYGSHNPRWWSWWRPLAPAQSSHLSHYGDSGRWWRDGPGRGAKREAFYNQHPIQSSKGPLALYWGSSDILQYVQSRKFMSWWLLVSSSSEDLRALYPVATTAEEQTVSTQKPNFWVHHVLFESNWQQLTQLWDNGELRGL